MKGKQKIEQLGKQKCFHLFNGLFEIECSEAEKNNKTIHEF